MDQRGDVSYVSLVGRLGRGALQTIGKPLVDHSCVRASLEGNRQKRRNSIRHHIIVGVTPEPARRIGCIGPGSSTDMDLADSVKRVSVQLFERVEQEIRCLSPQVVKVEHDEAIGRREQRFNQFWLINAIGDPQRGSQVLESDRHSCSVTKASDSILSNSDEVIVNWAGQRSRERESSCSHNTDVLRELAIRPLFGLILEIIEPGLMAGREPRTEDGERDTMPEQGAGLSKVIDERVEPAWERLATPSKIWAPLYDVDNS